MKKVIIGCFLLLLSGFAAQAQTESTSDSNTVVIHKDPRIDLLVKKQAQINIPPAIPAARPKVTGCW